MKCKCGATLLNNRTICYVCELKNKIAEDTLMRESTDKRKKKIENIKSVDKVVTK